MYILAVDPGTLHLGYAVFRMTDDFLTEWGEWSLAKIPSEQRYMEIYARLVEIETAFDLHSIAVEDAPIFRGKRIPELQVAVSTVYNFGKARLRGPDRNYRSRRYNVRSWKASIIGKGNATKEQVADGVRARIPEGHSFLVADVAAHVTDAVAIGMHHLAMLRYHQGENEKALRRSA